MRRVCSVGVAALLAAASLPAISSASSLSDFIQIIQNGQQMTRPVGFSPPQSNAFWLVVSSRPNEGEAIALAQSYAPTLGPTLVLHSRNGVFAVVAGTLYQDKAKANLIALKELHIIPQDSFLSRGEGLDGLVWMSYQQGASFDFATQPSYLRVVQTLQAAMSKLGLYSGAVDGLIGPTTVKAFRVYLSRFDLQPGELLTEYSLAEIERNAGDGFHSDQERNAARTLGYTDAQSFRDARSGGFTSASAFAQAKSMGFVTQRDYDDAVSGGFRSNDEYQQAKTGGFSAADEYRAAVQLSIQTRVELVAYRASGFSDPAAYRRARQKGFTDKPSYDKSEARKLKTARDAATALLSDAETFLKLNPQTSNLVEIAGQAAALNAQVQTASTDALNSSALRLTNLLMAVPGYSEFSSSRDKERAQAIEKQKAEIFAELQADQQALKHWMSSHLTSAKLPGVVQEVKALDEVSDTNDLDTLADAREGVRAMIARQALAAELDTGKTADGQSRNDNSQGSNSATYAVTDLNKALLRGRLEDVVVLYNSGPRAPSILRTISGQFSLTKNQARICMLGLQRTSALDKALLEAIDPMGGKAINVSLDCGANDLESADLFLVQRKTFLEAPPTLQAGYLEAMETKTIRVFDPIRFEDIKARMESDQTLALKIAEEVSTGTREGYGGILLTSSSDRICTVVDGNAAVHEATISKIADFAGMSGSTVSYPSIDKAYEDVRHEQCRVLYASTADLKATSEALARDGVQFVFAPVWLDKNEVASTAAKLDAAKQEATKAAEEKRVAADEEKKIAAQREADERNSKAARQADLRQKNGPAATALLNLLSDGLKRTVLGAADKASPSSGISMETLFPDFAKWNAGLSQDNWKPMDVTSEIQDYGTVNWKGRSLDGIVVKVTVKMASAERGQYKDECFLFGAVMDGEFQMVRDPYESRCNDTDASAHWAVGHELKSLWVAN
ncbi:peptidoglycan-binding domain-containing protein [Mesorhizobium sp. B2-8-3]|uniref:peptidoglycan-binding domain-containing protein n=1 Tax=Mesorhizobium sp. B2-8-3 TaxID=2589905 RepID=UPI00112D80C0|nr:peptidoglycan-binding domain-containing protein [Mesorhizobium sp. B2-8-3]TPJ22578.1 peptidoglycan-binding protein [Mesorhizobium sp. B2-8-3]